jgi:dTDP-4-amino-4,6-dideoxygalactose transaminase
MNFFRQPIFSGFNPSATREDTRLACSFLFLPWRWVKLRTGDSVKKVEDWFKKYFEIRHCFAFDSGRSSLFYALKATGVGEGDEILVQGYTCVVVSNAIIWTGAKPVYVDIQDDLNMDPADLEKKITNKAKVLIIQHTFGLPAKIDELIAIARKHNLKIIEDCAHSLGATYQNKLLGTFGDLSIFSFGSNKIVSCIRGGAVITSNDDFAIKLAEFRSRLPQSRLLKIFQHLWYYPIFAIGKIFYSLGIGKIILYLAKNLHLTARILYPAEKAGKQVLFYPALFPNSLATILLNQLQNLSQSNARRKNIAESYLNSKQGTTYQPNLPGRVWLYFTMFDKNPSAVINKLRKENNLIIDNDWTGSVIVPKNIKLDVARYRIGDCPNAERLCKQVINLPTTAK